MALSHQLTPDLANAIDLEVLIEHAPDLHAEHCIPLDARRRRVRATPPRVMCVIGGRGDLQHTTDRLDPVSPAMIVNEARSWPEPAVELRLGKIRAGLAQDLVGLAKLPVLALQRLHPLALVGRRASSTALVALGLATQL